MTVRRATVVLPLLLLLPGALTACGGDSGFGTGSGSDSDSASASAAKSETDDLARELLPELVSALDVQVTTAGASYQDCTMGRGWEYGARGQLVGAGARAVGSAETIASALTEAGLDVETRDDGSVLGSAGDLSVFVDASSGPAGPIGGLRSFTLTHNCQRYSDSVVKRIRGAEAEDYLAFVPEDARYQP